VVKSPTKNIRTYAGRLRASLAVYRDAEDLINIGAYQAGSNTDIDLAVELQPKITAFLQQGIYETSSWEETLEQLAQIFRSED